MKRVLQHDFHIDTLSWANVCTPAKETLKLFESLSYNRRVTLAEAAQLSWLKWSSPSYHRVLPRVQELLKQVCSPILLLLEAPYISLHYVC